MTEQQKEQARARRQQNKEKLAAQRKVHYEKHRAAILQKQAERRAKEPEAHKERERAAKRKAYTTDKERILANNRAWRTDNYARSLLLNLKSRARALGIQCNITIDDIIIPDTCPVLGIPLIPNEGGTRQSDNSPSVDRVDCQGGYTRGNVWVISWRANKLKSDGTLEEFRRLVECWPSTGTIVPVLSAPET